MYGTIYRFRVRAAKEQEQLVAVKTKYDPSNLFRTYLNIKPSVRG